MKKLSILFIFLSGIASNLSAQKRINPDSVLQVMNKVARWQIGQFAAGQIKTPEVDWLNGALYTGIVALKQINNDKAYDRFLYDIGGRNGWDMGPIRFFADDYCVAQMYTSMYLEHREPKMIAKWKLLADSIVTKTYNEPLKVVPNINHREWAWCDALYMGPTSLALLTTATGDKKYLAKADSLWWKTSAYLYDTTAHLFYRDSRFFDQREQNGEKIFWSRGNGWVIAGIAHMLEQMPRDFIHRKRYEAQFKAMAAKITTLQQADGSWHASLLDPVTYNQKETSGTGFFCYALAWGINNGLLKKSTYLPAVNKAWQALTSSVHTDGKLGYVQNVGSGPIKAGFETTNTYGVGAFLLAGTQVYRLYKK